MATNTNSNSQAQLLAVPSGDRPPTPACEYPTPGRVNPSLGVGLILQAENDLQRAIEFNRYLDKLLEHMGAFK